MNDWIFVEELLVNYGADVEGKDDKGGTAIGTY